jgi:hypothetical protein
VVYPYQIVTDIVATSRQAAAAKPRSLLVVGWWTCWCLAWITSFQVFSYAGPGPSGPLIASGIGSTSART